MSLINLVISARRAFSDWRSRERAYSELMALDDHALADIGIHRSQIGALVEGDLAPAGSPLHFPLPTPEKFARRKEA